MLVAIYCYYNSNKQKLCNGPLNLFEKEPFFGLGWWWEVKVLVGLGSILPRIMAQNRDVRIRTRQRDEAGGGVGKIIYRRDGGALLR